MKRVLSFLLLVVLLVTAIPVTATCAAETEPESEATTVALTEYDRLYVGVNGTKTENGGTLMGLYTAFGLNEAAAVVSTGKWQNKMDATGETDATVFETVSDTWTVGAKAGFGYTWVKADHSKTELKAGINLPASYADLSDFFVEASYTFHPLTDYSTANYYGAYAGIRLEYLASVNFPGYATTNVGNSHANRWILTGSKSLSHGSKNTTNNIDPTTGTVASRYVMYWENGFQVVYRANCVTVDEVKQYAAAGLTQHFYKDVNPENAVTGITDAYVTYGVGYNTGLNKVTNNYANPANLTYDQYKGMSMADTNVGHFSFFNNAPAEAYAIRVYDAVLTEAEKQHNHLIDLLAFYQVALPDNMANNPGLLDAAMASAFYATPFASDENGDSQEYDYSKIKKSLEDAISALTICTLSVTDGEDVTSVPVVSGESFTLTPPTAEEQTLIGWSMNGTVVALDATVTVTENTAVSLLSIPDMKVSEEVGVRVVIGNENGTFETPVVGMRFTADVDRAALDAAAAAGVTVLGKGMLIAPKDYVTAAGAFTAEALERYVVSHDINPERAYLDVCSEGFFEVSELAYTIAGGFGNFSEVTHEKNPLFAAVAYLELDYNSDGKQDALVYGLYEEEKAVRVTAALISLLAQTDMSDSMFEHYKEAYYSFYRYDMDGELPAVEDLVTPVSAPVISVKEGTSSEIVWDAVSSAKGYIVTVNGRDYPLQTLCSFTLPETGEYTVTVRSIGYYTEFDSVPSNSISLKYGFDEENVVLTFAAVADVHVGNANVAGKVKDIMLKTYEKYDVDAFLFAGDLTNAQNSNKAATVTQMSHFVSAVGKANAEKDLPIVWVMGNHDFPTLSLESDVSVTLNGKSYSFLAGTTPYDAALTMMADTSAQFFSEALWPVANTTVPDGFRYNKINGFSFVSVDYTHVTGDTMAWLTTQLDALVAAEPEKQIFLVSHMPSNSSSQPTALTKLMSNYPQIVYISGHTHVPFQNYSNFAERDGFVELIMGPGNHANYGVAVSAAEYCSYQMKQGVIVEVDASGQMRVKALDYSFAEEENGSVTSTLGQSYVVAEDPMVIRTAYFSAPTATARAEILYDSVVNSKSDERYFTPYFPENTKATFADFSTVGGTVSFTAAKVANAIKYYTVRLIDTTTNTPVNLYDPLAKKYAASYATPSYYIYYPTVSHTPYAHTFTLKPETDLDVTHSYTLYLQGTDDFGNCTKEYAFDFTIRGNSFVAFGNVAPKIQTVLNVDFTKEDYSGTHPRLTVKSSATDLSDVMFNFSNISLAGKAKGFGLMLATGYAYDKYGFMVAYVDDMVLIYRSGGATGTHTSTGTASFGTGHFIGAVSLDDGATSFSLQIKKESDDALNFYVNGILAGTQELLDGTCMIGGENGTSFNYTAAKIGLVVCRNAPVASGDAYTLSLGTSALTADVDRIAFTLGYIVDYSK